MSGKLSQSDLEIVHVKGSGPGGQNRNKRMSGVRITHLPTGLVVMATERRSQAQNLAVALERLAEKVARYFYRAPPRRPTKKTRGSNERRREQKARHGGTKRMRQKVSSDDY